MTPSSVEFHKSAEISEEKWTTVINASQGIFLFSWKELWEYRELIGLFVHRDFVSVYKQTRLGAIWHLLQPLLQALVFVAVFHSILNVSTNGIPPILFFLTGLACWRYFSDCANKITLTFTANQHLFDKIYFPRLVVPIAEVFVNLIGFVLQLLIFACLYTIYIAKGSQLRPDGHLLALPLLAFELGAFGMGVGCLMAALTARYRDLTLSMTFFMQLWMYASCVFYPVSQISPKVRWLVELNPIVLMIEELRYALMRIGTVTLTQMLYSLVASVIVLIIGLIFFNRAAELCVDHA